MVKLLHNDRNELNIAVYTINFYADNTPHL